MTQFHFPAATILILLLLSSVAPDIESDTAALLAFRSAVGGRKLRWDSSSNSPCSWPGVKCSPENSSVVELRLPGKSLSGQLPLHTISNITTLRTLSLRSNSLSGPLPADLFWSLKSLRNLYLHRNLFTGDIPDSLFSLTNIVHLNLADNRFSGQLSPLINNLSRLEMLYLENNRFLGSIPNLNIPNLVKFNVSYNNFTGKIPVGLSGMPKSSFIGNSLCGDPLDSCGDENKMSIGLIVGIIIGSVFMFLLIILLLLCWRRRLSRKGVSPVSERRPDKEEGPENVGRDQIEPSSGFPTASLRNEPNVFNSEIVFFGETIWNFNLENLLRASAEVLGKGSYGTTYKAALEMGPLVVVKRLKEVNVREEEFRVMMEEIGRVEHENLVPLKGYYSSKEEKLLVYEYMPMGSLSALLHGDNAIGRTPLSWETRAAIARGAARGIRHLHSQGSSVSHGNIKSSNILLTKFYEAKVSDFGLAPLTIPTATIPRVCAYRAPEVINPRKISQKADVYSFGVLLLELLTSKSPTLLLLNEEELDLPRWVRSVVQDEWITRVFDNELLRYQNIEEDMIQILQFALDCTEQISDKRPTMEEVTSKIEEVCSWSLQDSTRDIDG